MSVASSNKTFFVKAGIGHSFLAPGLEREKSTDQIITGVCACAFVYVCVCMCVNLSCGKCHEGKFRDAMRPRGSGGRLSKS